MSRLGSQLAVVLVVGLCILASLPAYAGKNYWTNASAPRWQQNVAAVVFHPTVPGVVFAAANPVGMFASYDGGATWGPVGLESGYFSSGYRDFAFDPSTLGKVYAAGAFASIQISNDWGTTWSDLAPCNSKEMIVVDPVKPKILYASSDYFGIFKSMDGGLSWTSRPLGNIRHGPNVLLIHPSAHKTLYMNQSQTGVMKSTDGGETWFSASAGIPAPGSVGSLSMEPGNGNILYGVVGGVIYRTVNGAQQWSVFGSGPVDRFSLVVDPKRPGVLYAASSTAVYRSEDGARTWATVSTMDPGVTIQQLEPDPLVADRFLARTSIGLMRTVDGCVSWRCCLPGLAGGDWTSIAIQPNSEGVLLAATEYGLERSTDGGSNWTEPQSGYQANSLVAFAPSSPNVAYAGNVWRSADWGATFLNAGECFNFPGDMQVHPADPFTLYFLVYGGLDRSVNGGATWSRIWNDRDSNLPLRVIIDPWSPNTMYLGVTQFPGGMMKSTDAGVTFAFTALRGMITRSLAMDPNDPRTIYAGANSYSNPSIMKTTDGGETSTPAASGIPVNPAPAIYALAVDPHVPQTVYAGTDGYGVYKSTDGGGSWSPFNPGLFWLKVHSLGIEPVAPWRIYAGTDGGGVFVYEPDPGAPLITGAVKQSDPYRIKVTGANFRPGCVVEAMGVRVPETTYKSAEEVIAKKGDALKAVVPKKVPTKLTVFDPLSGQRSPPFYFVP